MMAGSISPVAADDAPTIITAGKYEGVLYADLDAEELLALRRAPEVPRRAVEHEIQRRREAAKRRHQSRTERR